MKYKNEVWNFGKWTIQNINTSPSLADICLNIYLFRKLMNQIAQLVDDKIDALKRRLFKFSNLLFYDNFKSNVRRKQAAPILKGNFH